MVLKKTFFRIGTWNSRPPPFMEKNIWNFHFEYLNPSLRYISWWKCATKLERIKIWKSKPFLANFKLGCFSSRCCQWGQIWKWTIHVDRTEQFLATGWFAINHYPFCSRVFFSFNNSWIYGTFLETLLFLDTVRTSNPYDISYCPSMYRVIF